MAFEELSPATFRVQGNGRITQDAEDTSFRLTVAAGRDAKGVLTPSELTSAAHQPRRCYCGRHPSEFTLIDDTLRADAFIYLGATRNGSKQI